VTIFLFFLGGVASGVFDFVHPNPENDVPGGPDNTRFKSLKFVSQQASMMHGFAGYFESILYNDFDIILGRMHVSALHPNRTRRAPRAPRANQC